MNDEFDIAVLHSLRVTDLPPSMVDLSRAARSGRRRLRLRYAATAGVVAAVVLLGTVAIAAVIPRSGGKPAVPPTSPVPSASPASPTPASPTSARASATSTLAPPLGQCTIGSDPHPWVNRRPWVMIDDSWRVAVYLEGSVAVRWIDGSSERIRDVPAGLMVANASRSGDFAGVTNHNDKAWVYHDGRFTRLTMPPDGFGIAVSDMNDAGDIVGVVQFNGPVSHRAVVWPAGHPDQPRILAGPNTMRSRASGIAADGTVVGDVFADQTIAPYLWHPDGTGEYLPLPAEWTTSAQAPWGSGQGGAVGSLTGDWAVGPSVRWNIRTGRADLIEGLAGQGMADMYGRVFGVTPGKNGRSMVWINGTLEPVPQPAGGQAVSININIDGQHLSGQDSAGRWIEWTCGAG
jgi:hypothetical protein